MLSRPVFQVLFRLEQTYQDQFVFGSCVKAYLYKCKSLAQLFFLFYIQVFWMFWEGLRCCWSAFLLSWAKFWAVLGCWANTAKFLADHEPC